MQYVLYSGDKDIDVEMELYGGKGRMMNLEEQEKVGVNIMVEVVKVDILRLDLPWREM